MKRKEATGSSVPSAKANLDSLLRFWNRRTFHDMSIERMVSLNKRLVITLDEYILVLTGVTEFKNKTEEMPCAWLYQTVTENGNRFCLSVETDCGDFSATCADFRLLRASDMAVLIPPLDQ